MVRGACFNRTSPIVIGVDVVDGILKEGTPLCVPDRDFVKIGVVQSMEINNKPVKSARPKDGNVAVKIVTNDAITYGRQFDDASEIMSMISRDSIDSLKQFFADDMLREDWMLVMKLKKVFKVL